MVEYVHSSVNSGLRYFLSIINSVLSSSEREERIMFFDDENTGMGSEVEETPAHDAPVADAPAADAPASDEDGAHTEETPAM